MADSITTTTTLANQVQNSYQRNALFALRSRPVFDQTARVKPGNLTNPGDAVVFTLWDDLTVATTALSETIDPDAVALGDSQVTVTPNEYGNAVLLTLKMQSDTFLVGFDPDVANLVSYNMTNSIDVLARTPLDSATNTTYQGGGASATTIVATDILSSTSVRTRVANLRGADVPGFEGDWYLGIADPDVLFDLMEETGDGAWIMPHQYVDTMAVYNGEVGTFAGVKFLSSTRALMTADAGASSTVDVYNTYFLGAEALAKAESIPPHIVIGPVTDKLMRFRPVGWHTYAGWGILRQASVRLHKVASSIGSNT
jgi:N4-gp56 family major capsid protein